MTTGRFPKTIAAALAETQSKFALAEAIALEIPASVQGVSNNLNAELDAMRDEIIEAGGEARAIPTLARYRETALWVQTFASEGFPWVEGTSFTAHSEAYGYKVDWGWFSDDKRTTTEIRDYVGATPKAVSINVDELSDFDRIDLMKQLASTDVESMMDVVAHAKAQDIVKEGEKAAGKKAGTTHQPSQKDMDIASLIAELRREAHSLVRFLAPRWVGKVGLRWVDMSVTERKAVILSVDQMEESVASLKQAIAVESALV